jgi:hypothetical protein
MRPIWINAVYHRFLNSFKNLMYLNRVQLSKGQNSCDIRFISHYLRVDPRPRICPFDFLKAAFLGPLV